MSAVIVLAEVTGSGATKPTLELLTLARRIGEPIAVVLGEASDADVAGLGNFGATQVVTVSDPTFTEILVTPKVDALAQLAGQLSPTAVLISSTPEGKEIAGRLAVRLEAGVITDATDIAADGTTSQSVFAGNWTVRAKVTTPVAVITVKPNALNPEESPVTPAVRAGDVVLGGSARPARVVKTEPKRASGRPELSEAGIVVSGGRGTGGDFAPVEELADALGAAVGASRAAVDSGWYPHAYQVGQTGKTVSPQLYVAAGISGAIQHRAGMQTSKAVVVVNKDSEAPIFALADLGIVGDLHTVLPAATAEIAKRKG